MTMATDPAPRRRRRSSARNGAGALPVLSGREDTGLDTADGGVAVKERRRSLHAVLAGVVPEQHEGGAPAEWELHPTWWLFVITLYCVPLALTNALYTGILLPPLLSEIVNATVVREPDSTLTKQAAMGGVTTLISAIALSYPLMGWLSDSCRFRYCRSTFIVLGQLCALAGLAMSGLAARACGSGNSMRHETVPPPPQNSTCLHECCEASCVSHLCSWTVFMPGFFLFHFGYQVGWVPYMAVMPKIHPSQRAKLGGFTSFVEAAAGYGANAAGYGVGERLITTDAAFAMMIILNVIAVPLGTLSMQPRPGCIAPDNDNAEKKRAAQEAREAARGRAHEDVMDNTYNMAQLAPWRRLGRWLSRYRDKLVSALQEFLSAFYTCRAYRLMFLRGFIGSLNPFGIFGYYWYEDVFSPNFSFFGLRLTSSTQSAIAMLGVVSSTISFALSIPAGYLGDLIDRKPVLFWVAVIGTPIPLIYLLPVPFTVVIIVSVYGSITGSLLGPADRAFSADCLPRGKDGKPTDPSRDTALNAWQGVLPGLLMPVLGGQLFVWFPADAHVYNHYFVYRMMFVWGTVLSAMTTGIFYFVNPDEDAGYTDQAPSGWCTMFPAGAKLCDSLCFTSKLAHTVPISSSERAEHREQNDPQSVAEDDAQMGTETKPLLSRQPRQPQETCRN